MRGQAVWGGVKAYLLFLIRTVIFPLAWIWAFSLARRHKDTDPNGTRKVVTAILSGLVLAGGVTAMLYDFQMDSEAGMYDALDGRLMSAVGDSEYQDQITAIAAAEGQLTILAAKLDEANALAANESAAAENAEAGGNTEEAQAHAARAEAHLANATVFEASIGDVQQARTDAQLRRAELEPNHALYEDLHPLVQAQNDAKAKKLITDASFDYDQMDERAVNAFAIKDKAVSDMRGVMIWVLYPGIIGVFFAPMAIALGSILRTAWEPSESVGFKPYPGKALGLFLLMGAFGWPSLIFAAWGFWDMQVRSTTGQISL